MKYAVIILKFHYEYSPGDLDSTDTEYHVFKEFEDLEDLIAYMTENKKLKSGADNIIKVIGFEDLEYEYRFLLK